MPFEDYSAAVKACNLDIDVDGLYEEYAMVEGSNVHQKGKVATVRNDI